MKQMKFVIAFLLIFLSFSDGKVIPLDAAIVSTNLVLDPPPAKNVIVNVTWTFISRINITYVNMTINNLKSSQYAAMGLGQNQSMGEAHVFMCKRFANDTIVIQRFINPRKHTPPVPAGSEQGGIFIPLPGKFIDGVVTCQFTLSNFTSQRVKQLNTLKPLSQSGKYYPLFAVGLLNSTGDAKHHNGREHQPGLVQLDQNQNLTYHQHSSKLFNEIYSSS
ncbi:unnamed protein product [Rotaria sordida]|uniref:DOMON domain-containing protein n=1 Tax=Rotaria sordida TaxID=392033 RepID=A0A815BBX7_9BILA|nr:unnamed protein product [Rotaria sordida]CAF1546931.1 unnamed protein product [Rotaria sordida]